MVKSVKKALGSSLLVVGGGIRSGETARELAEAGADLIVTGTAVEKSEDITSLVREIAGSIKIR